MKRTKEEAEITKNKILKAAFEVFIKDGYSKARLKEVAKRAGVTRGAIYWHYGDKYKLFISLLNAGFKDYSERILAIIESKGSPLNKIRKLIREPLISILKDEKYYAGVVLYSLKMEFTEEKKKQWQMLQKQQEQIQKRLISIPEASHWLRTVIRDLIKDGIRKGEIRSDINPELASLVLMSYIDGVQSRFLTEPEAFKEKGIVDSLVEFVITRIAD